MNPIWLRVAGKGAPAHGRVCADRRGESCQSGYRILIVAFVNSLGCTRCSDTASDVLGDWEVPFIGAMRGGFGFKNSELECICFSFAVA